MSSDVLETGLKFDVFSVFLWGSQILRPSWLRVNWLIPGRTVNSQIASSTIQDTEYNINHAGIKGYEKTRTQHERNRRHRIEEILAAWWPL